MLISLKKIMSNIFPEINKNNNYGKIKSNFLLTVYSTINSMQKHYMNTYTHSYFKDFLLQEFDHIV